MAVIPYQRSVRLDKPTLSSSSSAFSGQNLVQITRIVCDFSGNSFLLRLSIAEFAFRHHFLLQLHLPRMVEFNIGVNSHVLLLIRSFFAKSFHIPPIEKRKEVSTSREIETFFFSFLFCRFYYTLLCLLRNLKIIS